MGLADIDLDLRDLRFMGLADIDLDLRDLRFMALRFMGLADIDLDFMAFDLLFDLRAFLPNISAYFIFILLY
jgi:hypothetical protein